MNLNDQRGVERIQAELHKNNKDFVPAREKISGVKRAILEIKKGSLRKDEDNFSRTTFTSLKNSKKNKSKGIGKSTRDDAIDDVSRLTTVTGAPNTSEFDEIIHEYIATGRDKIVEEIKGESLSPLYQMKALLRDVTKNDRVEKIKKKKEIDGEKKYEDELKIHNNIKKLKQENYRRSIKLSGPIQIKDEIHSEGENEYSSGEEKPNINRNFKRQGTYYGDTIIEKNRYPKRASIESFLNNEDNANIQNINDLLGKQATFSKETLGEDSLETNNRHINKKREEEETERLLLETERKTRGTMDEANYSQIENPLKIIQGFIERNEECLNFSRIFKTDEDYYHIDFDNLVARKLSHFELRDKIVSESTLIKRKEFLKDEVFSDLNNEDDEAIFKDYNFENFTSKKSEKVDSVLLDESSVLSFKDKGTTNKKFSVETQKLLNMKTSDFTRREDTSKLSHLKKNENNVHDEFSKGFLEPELEEMLRREEKFRKIGEFNEPPGDQYQKDRNLFKLYKMFLTNFEELRYNLNPEYIQVSSIDMVNTSITEILKVIKRIKYKTNIPIKRSIFDILSEISQNLLRAKVTIAPMKGGNGLKQIEKGYRIFLSEKMEKWHEKLLKIPDFGKTLNGFQKQEEIKNSNIPKENDKLLENLGKKSEKFVSFEDFDVFKTPEKKAIGFDFEIERKKSNSNFIMRMPRIMPIAQNPHKLFFLPQSFPPNTRTKIKRKESIILKSSDFTFNQRISFFKILTIKVVVFVFSEIRGIAFYRLDTLKCIKWIETNAHITSLEMGSIKAKEDKENDLNSNFFDTRDEKLNNLMSKKMTEFEQILILGDSKGRIYIIDIFAFEVIKRIDGHRKPIINCFDIYFGTCLMSLDSKMTLRFWEVKNKKKYNLFKTHYLKDILRNIDEDNDKIISKIGENLDSKSDIKYRKNKNKKLILIRKLSEREVSVYFSPYLYIFELEFSEKTNLPFLRAKSVFRGDNTPIIPYQLSTNEGSPSLLQVPCGCYLYPPLIPISQLPKEKTQLFCSNIEGSYLKFLVLSQGVKGFIEVFGEKGVRAMGVDYMRQGGRDVQVIEGENGEMLCFTVDKMLNDGARVMVELISGGFGG